MKGGKGKAVPAPRKKKPVTAHQRALTAYHANKAAWDQRQAAAQQAGQPFTEAEPQKPKKKAAAGSGMQPSLIITLYYHAYSSNLWNSGITRDSSVSEDNRALNPESKVQQASQRARNPVPDTVR